MGLINILTSLFCSVAENTVRQRNEFARQFEKNNTNMSQETRKKFEKFNSQTDKFASKMKVDNNRLSSHGFEATQTKVLGKTINQWNSEWRCIGGLKDANLTPYNNCVGLYRHVIDGQTKYVGRATELYNGGFRKRLSDYRRDNDSARKHKSGKTIYENLDRIITYILIVGENAEAIEATKELEGYFIRRFNPEWNRQINI